MGGGEKREEDGRRREERGGWEEEGRRMGRDSSTVSSKGATAHSMSATRVRPLAVLLFSCPN